MFPVIMSPVVLAQVLPNALPQDPEALLAAEEMKWKTDALKNLWGLDFKLLEREDWIYVVTYYGLRVSFVLVLMILAWTVSSWASAVVRTGLRRVNFDETLTKFLAKLVRWGILLLVGLTCLSYFGVETTSFAAVIGAAGLAIGLAFQGTLSNFAAGAMLLVFRPYKVGDVVNVAGNLGKVYEIELFSTAIDTFDNRRFIVPNSEIYGSVIENITYHAVRRIEVEVGTSYAADIDATRAVLEQAIASVTLCLQNPEPAVVLTGLGASSVDWSVRAWARNDDYGDAKQALIRAVKMELDRAKIDIPYPHLEVQMNQTV